jgi:hypothetical protein
MQEQLDYAAQDAHICVRLFDSHLGAVQAVTAVTAPSYGKFPVWAHFGVANETISDNI